MGKTFKRKAKASDPLFNRKWFGILTHSSRIEGRKLNKTIVIIGYGNYAIFSLKGGISYQSLFIRDIKTSDFKQSGIVELIWKTNLQFSFQKKVGLKNSCSVKG